MIDQIYDFFVAGTAMLILASIVVVPCIWFWWHKKIKHIKKEIQLVELKELQNEQ